MRNSSSEFVSKLLDQVYFSENPDVVDHFVTWLCRVFMTARNSKNSPERERPS